MKTHTLVLEVPDEIYQRLIEIAQREGKTPEQVAVEILEMYYREKKTESL